MARAAIARQRHCKLFQSVGILTLLGPSVATLLCGALKGGCVLPHVRILPKGIVASFMYLTLGQAPQLILSVTNLAQECSRVERQILQLSLALLTHHSLDFFDSRIAGLGTNLYEATIRAK